uniref:Uncharacterized protein n=1 Tax=Cacopsylla melanoneura TaxID=428564 RepID=A0A8D9EJT6_9HEMI
MTVGPLLIDKRALSLSPLPSLKTTRQTCRVLVLYPKGCLNVFQNKYFKHPLNPIQKFRVHSSQTQDTRPPKPLTKLFRVKIKVHFFIPWALKIPLNFMNVIL